MDINDLDGTDTTTDEIEGGTEVEKNVTLDSSSKVISDKNELVNT